MNFACNRHILLKDAFLIIQFQRDENSVRMGRTSFAEDDKIPVYNRDLLICWSVADFSIETT